MRLDGLLGERANVIQSGLLFAWFQTKFSPPSTSDHRNRCFPYFHIFLLLKIAVKESSAASQSSQSNYHSALFCFAHYGVISNAVGPEPSSVSNACIEQATLLSWKSSNGSTARAISGLFKREMRPFRNKHPECFLASQMPEDCRELISEKELSPRPRLPNVSSEVLSENALLETLQQIVAII